MIHSPLEGCNTRINSHSFTRYMFPAYRDLLTLSVPSSDILKQKLYNHLLIFHLTCRTFDGDSNVAKSNNFGFGCLTDLVCIGVCSSTDSFI